MIRLLVKYFLLNGCWFRYVIYLNTKIYLPDLQSVYYNHIHQFFLGNHPYSAHLCSLFCFGHKQQLEQRIEAYSEVPTSLLDLCYSSVYDQLPESR